MIFKNRSRPVFEIEIEIGCHLAMRTPLLMPLTMDALKAKNECWTSTDVVQSTRNRFGGSNLENFTQQRQQVILKISDFFTLRNWTVQ